VPPVAASIGTAPSAGNPATRWVRIDWAQHLTANAAVVEGTSRPLWQIIGYYFVANKSELFPFDQATLDSYRGILTQNPGY
jgi:hypothetical protein